MRRLPMPDSSNLNPIAIRTRPVCYTDAEELAFSRDIDKRGYWRSPDFWNAQLVMSNALPTEILLTQGEQSDDPSLILDVADGKTCPLCARDTCSCKLISMSRHSPSIQLVQTRPASRRSVSGKRDGPAACRRLLLQPPQLAGFRCRRLPFWHLDQL